MTQCSGRCPRDRDARYDESRAAAADFAAPRAGLGAVVFDELLESVEVVLRAVPHEAQEVSRLFDEALRSPAVTPSGRAMQLAAHHDVIAAAGDRNQRTFA